MAFKPKSEQSYYFIAKHSGLPLSIPQSPQWAQVEQRRMREPGIYQEFRMDPGEWWYWIMPEYKNRYLAVNGGSMDDTAAIIRYQWGTTDNFKFEFMYSGKGYYFIRAIRSDKYFDIYGADRNSGGKLVQHTLNGGDNQLFRPVLIPGKSGMSGRSFVEVNEDLRNGALAVISQVPEVGGGLKFVIGMFWTANDKLADLWGQMKEYVELRINKRITEERVLRLESVLAGVLKEVKKINRSTETDRGTRILTEISSVQKEEKLLFDGSLDMLPYLVAFGTLIISMHKTLLTNYAEFYGHPITPALIISTREELDSTIEEYTNALNDARTNAMNIRMAHIKDRVTRNITNRDEVGWESVVEDTFDGWRQVWDFRALVDDGRETGYSDHAERADFAIEQRRNQVREQYAAMLDEFMLVGEEWKYFNPTNVRPTGVKRNRTVGIYGGRAAGKNVLSVPGGAITRIVLHEDTGKEKELCGLEVFYGDTSSGLAGKKGSEREIDLTDDYVTGVYGIALNKIKSLTFTSSKGKRASAGNPKYRAGNELFTADLADGLDSRLVAVTGTSDDNNVLQLSFKWEFAIKDPE